MSETGGVPGLTNWENSSALLRNSVFKFKPVHTGRCDEMGVCLISTLKLLFGQLWPVFVCGVCKLCSTWVHPFPKGEMNASH